MTQTFDHSTGHKRNGVSYIFNVLFSHMRTLQERVLIVRPVFEEWFPTLTRYPGDIT